MTGNEGMYGIFGDFTLRNETDSFEEKVVGGIKAPKGLIPWQVRIEDTNSGTKCGGTVLNLKFVMSAGHCADGWTQSFNEEVESHKPFPANVLGKTTDKCSIWNYYISLSSSLCPSASALQQNLGVLLLPICSKYYLPSEVYKKTWIERIKEKPGRIKDGASGLWFCIDWGSCRFDCLRSKNPFMRFSDDKDNGTVSQRLEANLPAAHRTFWKRSFYRQIRQIFRIWKNKSQGGKGGRLHVLRIVIQYRSSPKTKG